MVIISLPFIVMYACISIYIYIYKYIHTYVYISVLDAFKLVLMDNLMPVMNGNCKPSIYTYVFIYKHIYTYI
jgi:hypothetical protein